MIRSIIAFSVKQKLVIVLLVLAMVGFGLVSLRDLPIDAVPDITNNQVQIVTVSSALSPQEIEQFITYPVEVAMANIPNVTEIRSISRYGLSVVTIVFRDWVPVLHARQYVKEQLEIARNEIPDALGAPELMPITTGLGEIYQYVLRSRPGYEGLFDPMELRTIQDWIVKRQLLGIAGIIEISSFGGYLKQYEVAIDPAVLRAYRISVRDVFEALERNNQNSGGSYIEKQTNAYYIRSEGLVENLDDIRNIVVATRQGIPVLVRDIAEVRLGKPKRFGAMTMDGEGEAVGGITLMLRGANSSEAIQNVHRRIEEIQNTLPEGLEIYPYLDRSVLVGKTIHTVRTNLWEGGLIVVIVLFLLLGNLRAGLIVASIIPLSLLFAIIFMRLLGVSANLMSLGAIDFGIVVDGAVIVIEGVLHALFATYLGKKIQQAEMDKLVIGSASKLFRSAVYGVFIILVVFIPIMTLTGIEGKMFRPMAITFSLTVLGALILSLTYVPMMASILLPKHIRSDKSISTRIVGMLRRLYRPVIEKSLRVPYLLLGIAGAMLVSAFLIFRSLGAEFIPTLEEGDLAMQMTIHPGSSLQQSIHSTTRAEELLLRDFPEVKHVISKIGTAEVPTDPMAIEDADIMIILKEKEDWVSADNREDLVTEMKDRLTEIPGASFEFTQPIELRFNELITGAKTDIAIKIFGEDLMVLRDLAYQAAALIENIPGAADVRVDQTQGLPQLAIRYDRKQLARYGLSIEDINTLVRTAYAGESAGYVYENERRFDLVVRLKEALRQDLDLSSIYLPISNGEYLALSEVARVEYVEGPLQISRENARRRINIGVNVRNRDVASLVSEMESRLDQGLQLPPGYQIVFGGEFENLRAAQRRLSIAVPVALVLIFILLFFTFKKFKYALIIFTAVPLSAIGGVFALWVRGMPFSISAGVGFIALFGVAVLNGIVLISYFNQLRYEKGMTDLKQIIIQGGATRLRPVIMTATVAALGFLPMALSTSNGAEVQKPLATVVIGGLITATILTLLVLPVLYYLVNKRRFASGKAFGPAVVLLFVATAGIQAQDTLPLDSARWYALQNHPQLKEATLRIEKARFRQTLVRERQPLDLSLESGQINTGIVDYRLDINQQFEPLGSIPAKTEYAGRLAQATESEQAILAKELTYQVSDSWLTWKYAFVRSNLYARQLALYADLLRNMELRASTGASERADLKLTEIDMAQAKQRALASTTAYQNAWTELQKMTWLEGDFVPDTDALDMIAVDTTQVLSGSLLMGHEARLAAARAFSVVQQKAGNPSLGFGYFLQSIRPEWLFQGLQFGISVPLQGNVNTARRQEARVDALIAENALDGQRFELRKTYAQTKMMLASLAEQIENFLPALESARDYRSILDAKRQNGAIDQMIYLQSLRSLLSLEATYLDLVFTYNQQALLFQFLTDNS